MPAYQDKSNKTWYCKFYYFDAEGISRQKLKRGFKLKRDAEAWERQFIHDQRMKSEHKAVLLPWPDFVDQYVKDTDKRLAAHSRQTRSYTIKNHVRPAFSQPVNEIPPSTIQAWTNSLTDEYSLTHSRNIYKQMRAVFNHAMRLYGLTPNPCHRVQPPTKRETPPEMQFWTYDEFSQAISHVDDLKAKTAIILLYWSGIRKGELLALTWSDIQGNILNIDKSYQRIDRNDVVTPPKTASSVRQVILPSQALKALTEWHSVSAGTSESDPIFPWEKRFIEDGIQQAAERASIKRIRVHDLRHSHASYLISKGANIKLVSTRLGHKKTSVTLDTYSHMFPSDEQSIVDIMEKESK